MLLFNIGILSLYQFNVEARACVRCACALVRVRAGARARWRYIPRLLLVRQRDGGGLRTN